MRTRTHNICTAVARAVGDAPDAGPLEDDTLRKGQVFQRLASLFFCLASIFPPIFDFEYSRYCSSDFLEIRHQVWTIEECEYTASFCQTISHTTQSRRRCNWEAQLIPVGDLGYSGSTFLMTSNGKYIAKSLDRRFEYRFFMYEIFRPYVDHMTTHPGSLLVRVTDMLYVPGMNLSRILGLSATHLVVMENLLHGKEKENEDIKAQWSAYDLKPDNYFFPERDIAGGSLTSQNVKNKLVDKMPSRLRVSAQMADQIFDILNADTEFLANSNVVDYSLFLVRFPGPCQHLKSHSTTEFADTLQAARRNDKETWRSGVTSIDGKWIYRIIIIDFFWARHKLQPKILSALVKAFNIYAKKGPMSITTDPFEYKRRFMNMVHKLISGSDT
ncbi:SAICAR synthase-like protein [Trichoderma evansii]